MYRGATFSDCGTYRYELRRAWGINHTDPLSFVMLNPSTAGAEHDDATIRKCIKFAKTWGYGGIVVVNLFAFRSTDPSILPSLADPCGPNNTRYLADAMKSSDKVICAWGKHGGLRGIGPLVLRWMHSVYPGRVHALKLNKDRSPMHPLYIPDATLPFPIEIPT